MDSQSSVYSQRLSKGIKISQHVEEPKLVKKSRKIGLAVAQRQWYEPIHCNVQPFLMAWRSISRGQDEHDIANKIEILN